MEASFGLKWESGMSLVLGCETQLEMGVVHHLKFPIFSSRRWLPSNHFRTARYVLFYLQGKI